MDDWWVVYTLSSPSILLTLQLSWCQFWDFTAATMMGFRSDSREQMRKALKLGQYRHCPLQTRRTLFFADYLQGKKQAEDGWKRR